MYTKKTNNHYQLIKLKEFFKMVKENFVIESFTDNNYRMLVTVPEVFVEKSEQNIWNVEIWIADELFDYLHPFLFDDLFDKKLSKEEFQVLFEVIKVVIKVYSSEDIRKEFSIEKFLDNYPSTLRNQQKKQMKEYFFHYFKVLKNEGKLDDKVLDISSNKILDMINISHSKIAVFENMNIQFS